LLVNFEAVVLAVYRAPDHESQLSYVSSPDPGDVIHWDDKLFVVAPPHQVEKLLKCTDKFLNYSRSAASPAATPNPAAAPAAPAAPAEALAAAQTEAPPDTPAAAAPAAVAAVPPAAVEAAELPLTARVSSQASEVAML
jgi:hypothetical protein